MSMVVEHVEAPKTRKTPASKPLLRFEDLLPKRNLGVGYIIPNEDVAAWRKLTRGKTLNRVAAICSGGEVGFFSLLPSVREELVLVDHNYHSLRHAMLKYLLLREHGVGGCLALFADDNKLREAVKRAREHIPAELLTSAGLTNEYGDEEYEIGDRLVREVRRGGNFVETNVLTKIWKNVNAYERRQLSAKLDKVQFIHGDFATLKDRGPFDLFYVSNAHESGNGNLSRKPLAEITALIRPGGYILSACALRGDLVRQPYYTGRGYNAKWHPAEYALPEGWTLVEEAPRKDGMSRWVYHLYQIRA